jgi:amino acid transporter
MTALLRAVLDEDRPKLKRSLGLWMATALVIGNMVGSGVFLLPGGSRGEAGAASIFDPHVVSARIICP